MWSVRECSTVRRFSVNQGVYCMAASSCLKRVAVASGTIGGKSQNQVPRSMLENRHFQA